MALKIFTQNVHLSLEFKSFFEILFLLDGFRTKDAPTGHTIARLRAALGL